jgi:hypothetical protein
MNENLTLFAGWMGWNQYLEHLQESTEKYSLKTCFQDHKKNEDQFFSPPTMPLKIDLSTILIVLR